MAQLDFPLLIDESEVTGALTLTKSGGAVRKDYGYVCDGHTARLLSTDLPAWLQSASGALGLQATIRAGIITPVNLPTIDYYLILADASGNPKASVALGDDAANPGWIGQVKFHVQNGASLASYNFGRPRWQFQGLLHEAGGLIQAVHVLDDSKVLYSVHFSNTLSRVYEVDRNTWTILRQFDFPSPYNHIASITYQPNYGFWVADYATGKILQINLEQSLSTGSAVILCSFTMFSGLSGLAFLEHNSSVYLAASQFGTSGTYTHIINPALITDGGTYSEATHKVKKYANYTYSQGLVYTNGYLYESHSIYTGYVNQLDIGTFLNSGNDGADYTTFLLNKYQAPSRCAEDLSVDSEGYIWCGTEGYLDVNDDPAFVAMWRSKLVECPEKVITINYDGTKFSIYQQGFLHRQITITPFHTPTAFAIGGKVHTSSGVAGNGFASGYVKCVRLQDSPISTNDVATIASGSIETRSLLPLTPVLTNPGAELGNANGWTNEIGTLGVNNFFRPYAGNYYFFAGQTASTKARQRIDLLSAGLTDADIDEGKYWAVVVWRQSGYDGVSDPGALGFRFLNASQVQISETITEEFYTKPGIFWQERAFALGIPADCRYLDVIQKMTRTGGTNSDAYFDNIELYIYKVNEASVYAVYNDATCNIETRTPIQIDSSFPIDYRIVSGNNLILNIDYRNSIINIIREAVLPVEWVKQIISDTITPIEIRNDQQFKLILVSFSFMGQS